MPNLSRHQRAADRFLAAVDASGNEYPEVLGLLLYLSSLHLVEAVACLDGKHYSSHAERRTFLIDNHRKIVKEYTALEDAGRKARYYCHQFDWRAEELRDGAIRRRYNTLRRWAEKEVADAGRDWATPEK